MRSQRWLALAGSSALALALAACGGEGGGGGAAGGGGGGRPLSGQIAIDGSSTVQPFSEAAAELFNEQNPDVRITVGGAGTGDGFEKFCKGETDISDASREIEPGEEEACGKENIKTSGVQVANDGIAVASNKGMVIDCLKTEQLKELFEPDSSVQKYSDIDPKLPPNNVSLFTPGTESGTFEFFAEEINEVEEPAQREENVQTSADDNQLVTGVSGDQNGLGYFGFSFFEQNQDKLNPIAVDAGEGCVRPSLQTIQGGQYKPLSRPLFMYPSQEDLKRPEVKAFMDFVVSNQQRIAETARIVPMTAEQGTQAESDLSKAEQG